MEEVSKLVASIRKNEKQYEGDQEVDLNLKINALVAQNAEEYYRAIVRSDELSWNVRDEHMVVVINEIMDYHGKDTKIIIWAHNTHIGDASTTDMKEEGLTNIGETLRLQNKAENVFAADGWGAIPKKMTVPTAIKDSCEDQLHHAGAINKILLFEEENRIYFNDWIGHRAIGVVYNPNLEAYGNYVPSKIVSRYDAFIYIDETTALLPIRIDE